MTKELFPEDFVRIFKRTLDSFVDEYKVSTCQEEQRRIDISCNAFIKIATTHEAYRLGFRNYYDERKGE